MILYSIQEAHRGAQLRTGRITGDGRRVAVPDRWPCRWLIQQLAERVGRPAGPRYPVWAWKLWQGKARPDLRCAGHLPPGAAGVLLELEVADERVLLLDFDAWIWALNHWCLVDSDAEQAATPEYDLALDCAARGEMPTGRLRRQIERSWSKLLQPDRPRDEEWWGDPAQRSVAAVVWDLRPEDVRCRTHFCAR